MLKEESSSGEKKTVTHHGVIFRRLVLALLPGALLLHAASASADWTCSKRLPSGECLGPATLSEGGERLSGMRALVGPQEVVWLGKLTRIENSGLRSECSYAPSGRCEGQLTTFFSDGKRRIESLRIQAGIDEYEGISVTLHPDGRKLECVVDASGACNGEAVMRLPSKEILHGVMRTQGYDMKWVGSGRWTFAGGEVKDCVLGPEGECRAGPVTFWSREAKLVGTLDANGDLSGPMTTYDNRGQQKSCAAATPNGCKVAEVVSAKAPAGAAEKPRPRKFGAQRSQEISAAIGKTASVVIGPPLDSAEIRYQFLVCGDDIRVAYTVARAANRTVPLKGRVFNRGALIGTFDDPRAAKFAAPQVSCKGAQTRTVASLKQHQQDLIQYTFSDGSEAWPMDELIRRFLNQLTIKAFPVVGQEIAAAVALPIAVPVPISAPTPVPVAAAVAATPPAAAPAPIAANAAGSTKPIASAAAGIAAKPALATATATNIAPPATISAARTASATTLPTPAVLRFGDWTRFSPDQPILYRVARIAQNGDLASLRYQLRIDHGATSACRSAQCEGYWIAAYHFDPDSRAKLSRSLLLPASFNGLYDYPDLVKVYFKNFSTHRAFWNEALGLPMVEPANSSKPILMPLLQACVDAKLAGATRSSRCAELEPAKVEIVGR